MLLRELCTIQTADGWKLAAELVVPAAPKAAAVLGHAMMVDRRTMDRRGEGLATTLAERGIVVLNADLRGHGGSGPTTREGGRYGLDDFVMGDMPALTSFVRARFPKLGVAVVGHSLAGTAALLSAGHMPETAADAIAVLTSNIGLWRHDPSLARRLKKLFLFGALYAVALPFGRLDPKPFRLGTDAEPMPYIRHYSRIGLTGRFTSADGSVDYIEAMRRVTAPVLAIASDNDPFMGAPDAVFPFIDELTSARVLKRRLQGPDAPTHMGMVTDLRSRPVWQEIAGWILQTLVKNP